MKRLLSVFAVLLFFVATAWAGVYPIDDYDEPRVGNQAPAAEWNALSDGLHAIWGNRDVLYVLHRVPQIAETTTAEIRAWKGERANLSAVLFSNTDQGELHLRFVDGAQQSVDWCQARFQRYVITDDYKQCGNHNMSLMQWLVPDVIDQDKAHAVPARETRPVWCTVEVPRDATAGKHTVQLQVLNAQNTVVKTLNLTVNILDRALPEVANQKFHLDFWQQPYAVSRYYGVERWSDAHIQALRPYLAALGRAGQKVVSTIMFYEPWGNQSHDKFSAMIQTTRKADGTWAYDYTIFDKYVELCAEYGITEQINCYSMVPWDMTFRYYDEEFGRDMDVKTSTNSNDYREIWNNFLDAFKAHLQEKGWFDKTCIAMDERGEGDMLNAYNIAKAKGFKMALAGNYHSSLSEKLYDYSFAPAQVRRLTAKQRQYRKQNNLPTTVYFCCADAEPNIFTNSLSAEAVYLPLHAAANDLDGLLHWSWINWDEHPLTDSRFRLFGAGDTYCYYPGNRSSVRFERLIEGIHQFEKIQILKEEYKDNAEKLAQLNTLLAEFADYSVAGSDCSDRVNRLEAFLNSSEESEDSEETTLFSTLNGGMDIPPYRIPGITCGGNGRLVASVARLVCGTDPGFGQVDCVVKISDDNGRTWSAKEIDVAVGNASLINNTKTPMEAAYGDPAVVMDRERNEVLVMAVGGCTVYTNATTNRQNPNIIAAVRSLDGGLTWQTPEDQTEAIYSLFDNTNPLAAAFVSGGKIFQSRVVKMGDYYRIYAALAARPDGNRVVYSDDFGRTWLPLGGASALPLPNGDEAKSEELPDGRVIITGRVAGGRYFNIFTYSNTANGEGEWDTPTKATMDGLSAVPSTNATNGEMLVVPAKRKSDGKQLYLVLQSMPTGTGRENVGIFYKELADFADIRDVNAFASDWDGFYQVSSTSSAYSSLDLQADDKIAFFYEETLTKWGVKPNPVSTSFPTGEGTHNFDGFENIYLPLSLETITGGAYSVARNINRGDYLRDYFNALIDASDITSEAKTEVKNIVAELPADPTAEQIDHINALIAGSISTNAWDGKTLTFTNVQQSGAEHTLYIDNSTLVFSQSSADDLGTAAQFRCRKEASGKYSFFNDASGLYMIWRAGNNYGYNDNAGTLATYVPTYCDWSIVDATATKANTYYLVSKRSDGTTDGSLIIMATGVFDSYLATVGWTATFSNLFRIDIVDTPTAIGDINSDCSPCSGKYLHNGNVYIVRNGYIYNVAGQRVK